MPPRLRERMRSIQAAEPLRITAIPQSAPTSRFSWIRDISGLSLAFLLVAIANVVVLLLALWFLQDGAAQPPLPLLDPKPLR